MTVARRPAWCAVLVPLALSSTPSWADAAAPAPAPAPAIERVLVLDLRTDSAPEETARLIRDEVAVQFQADGRFDVLSSEDIRRVVNVEAQRQSLGCSEESCLAEIGSAMGARYIVHGSIGTLGTATIVHLNLFDTERARALARETAEARSKDDLLIAVRGAVQRLKQRALPGGAPPPSTTTTTTPSPLLLASAGVTVVGALAAVVGAGMVVLAIGPVLDASGKTNGDSRRAAQGLGQVGSAVLLGGVVVGAAGGAALTYALTAE